MSEAKSRFGIMQELSDRKIREREKLNKLETETETNSWKSKERITDMKEEVKEHEKTYVRVHKNLMRELEIKKRMLEADMKRKLELLEKDITFEKDNYEPRFQDWKSRREIEITKASEGLTLYEKNQTIAIKNQNSILTELDANIKDLKEISEKQN